MTATGATEVQHAPARAMRWSARQVAMAVAGLSALWFVVGVNVPRLWVDEQFTDQVSRMSWSRFWAMLGERDAVHGAYYVLVRLSQLHGWPMRLLSAAAAAAAAGGVYLLARRLAGPRAAWIAAVLFAGAPMTTRFAQEARPTAFVTAAAVFSTLALVERRWGWYAAAVAALGSLSIFGLLLLPAHFMLTTRRERGRWALWCIAGVAACIPVLVLAAGQRGQVSWIGDLDWAGELLTGTWSVLIGMPLVWPLVWAAAACGALLAPKRWAVAACWWLCGPSAILGLVSVIDPVYWPRYVMFSAPALALLAAVGLARLPLRWLAAVLTVLALVALPVQAFTRTSAGHGGTIDYYQLG